VTAMAMLEGGGRLIFMLGKSSGGQRWHPLEYYSTLLEGQYWSGPSFVLVFSERGRPAFMLGRSSGGQRWHPLW